MRYLYYEHIGQMDKRAAAYNDMLEEESRMVARMSNRTNGQQSMVLPNLSFYIGIIHFLYHTKSYVLNDKLQACQIFAIT